MVLEHIDHDNGLVMFGRSSRHVSGLMGVEHSLEEAGRVVV